MKLYHPSTVLGVALVLVTALQVTVGLQFDRAACATSPRGAEAGFPLDDAWIHQVYARSFGDRMALEYNPGEAEVGQSSLLWGMLLGPVNRYAEAMGIPVAHATRLCGIAVWILVALAAALFVRSLPVPGARFGAFAAAILITLDPALAFCAVSGMEPLLLSLWTLLGFHYFFRGRPLLTGVCAGLAILSRPEGLLVAAMLIGGTLLRGAAGGSDEEPRKRLQPFLAAALPCLLLAYSWLWFCLSVSGRPFPNTYYVKAFETAPLAAVQEGASLLAGLLAESPFYKGYVGYLFFGIGIIALLARCGAKRSLLLLLTPLLFVVGLAATRWMPDPQAFFWQRYLTPMIPLLDVFAAIGFAALGAVLADTIRRPREEALAAAEAAGEAEPEEAPAEPLEAERIDNEGEVDEPARPVELPERPVQPFLLPDFVLAIFLAVFAIVPFAAAPAALQEQIDEYARNVADVDRMNVEAALWLADQRRVRDDMVIATQDAGAVRYFTENHVVLDLIGLNDHELVTHGLAGAEIGRYLERRSPEVFVLLDPDPGAVDFLLFASRRGMREVERFGVDEYSLFGEPTPRSVVILADLPP